jgi:ABC-type phosphate/phosphonate transport system substrate-binding protein
MKLSALVFLVWLSVLGVAKETLVFGAHPSTNPQELKEHYLELLGYLE